MITNHTPNLTPRLFNKIEAVQSEEDAYAADELVELGEEILSQLAAIGFAVYLQQPNQKEVFNDFLINLFTSSGHDHNAGPLYRWAANMILNADGDLANKIKPFFWEESEGELILNKQIHHLASLRNEVMHGFFVLPPERNKQEAEKASIILEQCVNSNLFETHWGDFSFLTNNGFNGNWQVADTEWKQFNSCFDFSVLAERIRYEWSQEFAIKERNFASKKVISDTEILNEVKKFESSNNRGALAIWNRPNDLIGIDVYRMIVQNYSNHNYLPISYSLNSIGVTYTQTFLLHQILTVLSKHVGDSKTYKDPLKGIRELRKKCTKRPIVILNNIHVGLFNAKHALTIVNELFDNEIIFLGIGEHYTYLNRYFNKTLDLKSKAKLPKTKEWNTSLVNYLRFKTSEKNINTEDDIQLIVSIIKKMLSTLKKENKIVVRQFADKYNYPIEFVNEAFSILHPYLNISNKSFELDEIDDLYDFPKEITESSRIFLSLGRRDIKLEYKHKILSL
jgi:hypothetical protein